MTLKLRRLLQALNEERRKKNGLDVALLRLMTKDSRFERFRSRTSSRLNLAASSGMEFSWVNLFATKFRVSVTTHFNYNMNNSIEGL